MKSVRFKKEYSDSEPRLSYELVSEETFLGCSNKDGVWYEYYNTKLLGLVPTYKMEEADGSEVPAIDVFIKLSAIKND